MPAATSQATTKWPEATAVRPQSKVAVAPGLSGPPCQVFESALTSAPAPPLRQLYLHAPGGLSTTHTGREWLATPGMFRYCANAETLVPSPTGAGYPQVVLQIETATSGIVLLPALRTESTRCVCCARRCELGNVAEVTCTGNLPVGWFTSWRLPLPQPASASAAARPATIVDLLPPPLLMSTCACCCCVDRLSSRSASARPQHTTCDWARRRFRRRFPFVFFAVGPIGLRPFPRRRRCSSTGGRTTVDPRSRRANFLADQVVAGRGRQHGDSHRQDDRRGRTSAVPLRCRVRGPVHVR